MLLREVGQYLIDQGVFTSTNLFEADMGTLDALKGALRAYGGGDSEFDMGAGVVRVEDPRFQLEVQGPDYTTTLEKLRAATVVLVGVVNQVLTAGAVSTRYLSIDAVGNIIQLPRDGNFEWRFAQSFKAMKAPSSA